MGRLHIIWDVIRGRGVVYRAVIGGTISSRPGERLRVVETALVGLGGADPWLVDGLHIQSSQEAAGEGAEA